MGALCQDGLADETVGRNITLTLTLILYLYILTLDVLLLTESGKRQTRPLVRESAPHQQSCNCLTVIKIWS
jgi:hypothetical protein